MARIWSGKNDSSPPPPSNGGAKTKTCPRCKGYGEITVTSAKTKEHGGFDDYQEDCGDCGGSGEVSA